MPTIDDEAAKFGAVFGAPDDGAHLATLNALTDIATPFAVRVVATLRIPDLMAGARRSADDLAAQAHVDVDALRRVLRHLATRELVAEPDDDVFEMTAVGNLLRSEHPSRIRDWLDIHGGLGRSDQAFSRMLDSVTTGRPAFEALFGHDFWQDIASDPARAAAFGSLMGAQLRAGANEVVSAYPWEGLEYVVDVGGGNGLQLAALLAAHTSLRGTLVDLPSMTAQADAVLEQTDHDSADLRKRFTTRPGSFFDPLPDGADLYLLSRVLHDWDDARATMILKNCAHALGERGRVLIVEPVLDEDPVAYPRTDVDLRMLVTLGGRERTFTDFAALAMQAGLTATVAGRTPSGRTLIDCVAQNST